MLFVTSKYFKYRKMKQSYMYAMPFLNAINDKLSRKIS